MILKIVLLCNLLLADVDSLADVLDDTNNVSNDFKKNDLKQKILVPYVGEMVILNRPLSDGIRYIVNTSNGRQIWRDRDVHILTLVEEQCKVIDVQGNEVLIYVPLMDDKYWFEVLGNIY